MRGKRITMQVEVECENCGEVIEEGEVARQWKIGEKWVFAHRIGKCKMDSAMDVAYNLDNTPNGKFYEIGASPSQWYEFPMEGVMRAVGAVWYSRIVYFGVNSIAGALPPNQKPQFIFQPGEE